MLMFVIISVATDTRAVGQLAALAIGARVALDALWGGPISGASMNPARSFGPAQIANAWQELGVLAWPHPWRDSRGVCLPVFANAAPPGNDRANLPALDVVLADMDARALASRYCLGDLVGYGTFPNEVVAALRERNIPP